MYQTSKIVISPRVRKSPYFDSTMKYGASAFTIYNHMYMPIVFEGPEKDYENLQKKLEERLKNANGRTKISLENKMD